MQIHDKFGNTQNIAQVKIANADTNIVSSLFHLCSLLPQTRHFHLQGPSHMPTLEIQAEQRKYNP